MTSHITSQLSLQGDPKALEPCAHGLAHCTRWPLACMGANFRCIYAEALRRVVLRLCLRKTSPLLHIWSKIRLPTKVIHRVPTARTHCAHCPLGLCAYFYCTFTPIVSSKGVILRLWRCLLTAWPDVYDASEYFGYCHLSYRLNGVLRALVDRLA